MFASKYLIAMLPRSYAFSSRMLISSSLKRRRSLKSTPSWFPNGESILLWSWKNIQRKQQRKKKRIIWARTWAFINLCGTEAVGRFLLTSSLTYTWKLSRNNRWLQRYSTPSGVKKMCGKHRLSRRQVLLALHLYKIICEKKFSEYFEKNFSIA